MDLQQPGNAPNEIFLSLMWGGAVLLQRIFFVIPIMLKYHLLSPHPKQHLSFRLLKYCFFMCEKFFQLETTFCWMCRWREQKLFKNWKKLYVKFLFMNYKLISTNFPFLTFGAVYQCLCIWRISLLHDLAEQLRNLSCITGFHWATVVARDAKEIGVS